MVSVPAPLMRPERTEEFPFVSKVPFALSRMLRAYEIGTRVASVGFDWPTASDVVDKIDEEVRELREVAGHDFSFVVRVP